MSPAPVLSTRAMQELLARNHKNFVSVRVGTEEITRVHRPVAMRFSRVWKSALQDPTCGEVTVTFPAEAPAGPAVSQSTPIIHTTDELNKLALKVIVQWMENGGAIDQTRNATPCPKSPEGLDRLRAVAKALQVPELANRVGHDVGKVRPAARPKHCEKCKRFEHPGTACLACWHCQELGHGKRNCPKAAAEFQEREARRKENAERAEKRRKSHEAWQKKLDEERRVWEERESARLIRTGEMAVGDGGKTILRWSSII